MSGLAAARYLKSHGWNCLVLDKGRSVGGRMATRRIGESRLDHGAQFFTARDAEFRNLVAQWRQASLVDAWFEKDGEVCYRAAGGMNALAKHMAQELEVRTQVTVASVEPGPAGWRVVSTSGEQWNTARVLLTAPLPQSAALLGEHSEMLPPLPEANYEPCFALLAVLTGGGLLPPEGFVQLEVGPVAWIADNTHKGISSGPAALTIHASARFSQEHFDFPQEQVAALLLQAASPWLGSPVAEWQLHRWRYARPACRMPQLFAEAQHPAPLLVLGDTFGGPRVEGACLSGIAAARRLAG
ncbi:MAG: FAD-dependent oxidoreductase [Bryobacterales bacterium]|nr:FAD-dependent oxidoreductase [Bryobacterales bacterium]